MIESGLYLTHKRVGQSSFDVVRGFKSRAYEAGQKKFPLGHGGTLDPFADGLLLVLAGQGTRLMELMHPLPKTYEATVVWGQETDTCDHLGLPVPHPAIPMPEPDRLNPDALDAALSAFLGWRDQIPPATCAKKIDGEAAYKKAHRGETFELRPSRVYLHEAVWLRHDLPRASILRITCRGGFYVRSLARDLGRVIGCGAHLSTLCRTAIGPWTDPGLAGGPDSECLVQGEGLIPWCATRVLDAQEADHLAHGRPIPLGEALAPGWALPEGFPDPAAPLRALHDGRLVALLRPAEDGLRTIANLRGGL
jgi:tRNA pseudouridine55 synthase